jgi:hypothetical protein
MRQSDVADAAGLSRTMVGRMELGRGGTIPLENWAAVAQVVGVRLDAVGRADAPWMAPIERRCHALVAGLARDGGWTAVTQVVSAGGPHAFPAIETVIARSQLEAVVIKAWHPVPMVEPALVSFEERLAKERTRRGDTWQISGLFLVPRTTSNRRRITEQAEALAARLPASGADWIRALRSPRARLPGLGLIWLDRWATRLRPARRRPGWERGW